MIQELSRLLPIRKNDHGHYALVQQYWLFFSERSNDSLDVVIPLEGLSQEQARKLVRRMNHYMDERKEYFWIQLDNNLALNVRYQQEDLSLHEEIFYEIKEKISILKSLRIRPGCTQCSNPIIGENNDDGLCQRCLDQIPKPEIFIFSWFPHIISFAVMAMSLLLLVLMRVYINYYSLLFLVLPSLSGLWMLRRWGCEDQRDHLIALVMLMGLAVVSHGFLTLLWSSKSLGTPMIATLKNLTSLYRGPQGFLRDLILWLALILAGFFATRRFLPSIKAPEEN